MRSVFTIIIVSSFLFGCRPTILVPGSRPTDLKTSQLLLDIERGALLVRLESQKNTLNALTSKNQKLINRLDSIEKGSKTYLRIQEDIATRENLINKITTKRDLKNQEIKNAFRSFSYCPVYFFYSKNSKQIINKEFKGYLLGENLQPLIDIPLLNNNYLIATFSYTQKDTNTYWTWYEWGPSYTIEKDGSYSHKMDLNSSYGAYNFEKGPEALILLSPEMIQLQDPYPHYVRTFENLPFIKRSKYDAVMRLQDKMLQYKSYPFSYWVDPFF